jgi:hypothetical protein
LSCKTPSSGRGQRKLALPVKCPSAKPFLELSPQFKVKGAADEQIYETFACIMVLPISHSMGSEVPVPCSERNCSRGSIPVHTGFSGRLDCQIVEVNVKADHIHLLVKIPKVSISEFMGTVKGRKSIRVFKKFPYLKERPYWGNHFWADG